MANVVKEKSNVKLDNVEYSKFAPRPSSTSSERLKLLNNCNLISFGGNCTEEEIAKWEILCNQDVESAQLDHLAGKMYVNGVNFRNGKFEF